MRFTSSIVRFINNLVKQGHNRSNATKKAFTWAKVEAFEQALATGKVVTVWFYKKDQAGKPDAQIEQRECISMKAAVEKGMFQVEGTGRPIASWCCGFFDLTINEETGKPKGPRQFQRDNFVRFA